MHVLLEKDAREKLLINSAALQCFSLQRLVLLWPMLWDAVLVHKHSFYTGC